MNDIDPRASVLRSSYYTPGQVLALGRIAELSALIETLLRNVLEQVMGLGQAAGETLFLGDRGSTLVSRIKALGNFVDMLPWFRDDAVEGAKRVDKALRDCDDLIHRAPTELFTDEDTEAESSTDKYTAVGRNLATAGHRAQAVFTPHG